MTWVELLSVAIGPIAAVLGTLGGVLVANRNARVLREQESKDRRDEYLRGERIRAYNKLLTEASWRDFKDQSSIAKLAEAHTEVEMLAESPEVLRTARKLHDAEVNAISTGNRLYKSYKKYQNPDGSLQRPYSQSELAKVDELLSISREAHTDFQNAVRAELDLPALPDEDS